jgi:hypothetical protein
MFPDIGGWFRSGLRGLLVGVGWQGGKGLGVFEGIVQWTFSVGIHFQIM